MPTPKKWNKCLKQFLTVPVQSCGTSTLPSPTDSNVTVVNFHVPTEKRSLIEEFFCDALHGMAPHACRAAMVYAPTRINAQYSLDADFVLAQALATNRIPSVNQTDDASIPNMVKDTQVLLACINKKLQKSDNLPVQCLLDNTQGYAWNCTQEWFPFNQWPRRQGFV